MNNHKIVIIGAGMAGLGTALTLIQHNITDFIILEASNRAGGRIHTLQVNNGVVELGAQWLHGIDNDLWQILQENDLIHTATSDEGLGIYVRNDGVIIDDFLVKKVDFEVGRILEECENFVDAPYYPKSVGAFLEERFKKFLEESNYNDEEKVMMDQLFDWHVRFQLIDNSCDDLYVLSAREWGRYSCLGKDGQQHINLKGGYSALVDALVKKLPEGIIQYGKQISSVHLNDNCSKLEIQTTEGSIIHAEFAIITCSLGVLKTLDFPQTCAMKRVINNMGFGGMGKVFLQFKHRWWHTDGYQLIWHQDSKPPGGHQWLKHLSGFDCVLDQPTMLVGWVSHLGIESMEKESDDNVGQQCVDLLRSFLKDDSIPYPIKTYKSRWLTNSFVKGSYSHATNACDTESLPIAKVLAEPYCDNENVPRIFLAGEAVHESHFSTTHGAFESGQIQARKLIQYFNVGTYISENIYT